LQLVGLNVKPGTIDIHVDVPYLRRDAIDDLRDGSEVSVTCGACQSI